MRHHLWHFTSKHLTVCLWLPLPCPLSTCNSFLPPVGPPDDRAHPVVSSLPFQTSCHSLSLLSHCAWILYSPCTYTPPFLSPAVLDSWQIQPWLHPILLRFHQLPSSDELRASLKALCPLRVICSLSCLALTCPALCFLWKYNLFWEQNLWLPDDGIFSCIKGLILFATFPVT